MGTNPTTLIPRPNTNIKIKIVNTRSVGKKLRKNEAYEKKKKELNAKRGTGRMAKGSKPKKNGGSGKKRSVKNGTISTRKKDEGRLQQKKVEVFYCSCPGVAGKILDFIFKF